MGKLKKFLYLAGCILGLSNPLWAPIYSRLNIQEQDGSPSVFPWQLRVTNGSLIDNGDGTASLSTNSGSGASLSSTNTWTAGQTFVSSSTFVGSVVISTSVSLNGSVGSNGNYFTSGGPGAVATWTDPTATFLTNSSATATYLQLSSATATYLQQSSATVTYLQISSATANYPKLGAGNLFTQSNTYSSSSTFNGAVIISTSINAGGQGSNGQFLTSGGSNGLVSWSSGASGDVIKASTQVFTGGNTFISSTTFSGTLLTTSSTTLKGTTTSDNAAPGNIGEIISNSIVRSASVPMSTGVGFSVSTVTLTAGDWDVRVSAAIEAGGATAISEFDASLNTVPNTLSTADTEAVADSSGRIRFINDISATPGNGSSDYLVFPTVRVSISSTTPYYLVLQANFSISTLTGYGNIVARRIR